jgi:hypothetical protein
MPIQLPNAPQPTQSTFTIKDDALYTSVAITRVLDFASTEQCQRDAWKGCHETELSKWAVQNKVALAGIETMMTIGSIEGQRLLIKHHYGKLAFVLQIADIAVMSRTVIDNYSATGRR